MDGFHPKGPLHLTNVLCARTIIFGKSGNGRDLADKGEFQLLPESDRMIVHVLFGFFAHHSKLRFEDTVSEP